MSIIQTQSPPIGPKESDYSSVLNNLESNNIAFLLDHLSLLSVEGRDAEKFLQNQFSNDISKVTNYETQLNAYCNPKGRILAMMYLIKRSDHGYWIIAPNDLSDELVKRLKIFVMRAKVTIEVEKELAMLGMVRDGEESFGSDTYRYTDKFHRSIAIGEPRQLYEAVNNVDQLLNSGYWRLCDILSGLPQIYSQTVEQCIPQHINLDLVSGISFSKGCYPGQEIIARLRYLGKSKYRLCVANAISEDKIEPGQALFEKGQVDQKAGLIVDAVETEKNQYQLSAMIKYSDGGHPDVSLKSGNGPELSFGVLPYEVPVE